MKKIYLNFIVIIMTVSFSSSYAQVGIGTTTPSLKSALDITSTTTGVLFPRVTTAQRTAIAPAGTDTGLKVYDTTTKSYWYWDGTIWIEQAANNNWNLTGNAGTAAGTNFIGTTDAQDFVTKTGAGGIERMRVLSGGHVLVNTPTNIQADNLFEVVTTVADDDAISGIATGNLGRGVQGTADSNGQGVAGFNATGNGMGVLGQASSTTSTGSGVRGESLSQTGYGMFALNTAGGTGLFAQTGTAAAANQDVAAIIGSHANIRQGTGGYAGPLAASTDSALAGVSGTFASKETVTTSAYFFGVIGDVLRDSGVPGSTIPNRSGGVLGFSGTAGTFGMLGYRNSAGTLYGMYGNAAAGTGTGKMKTAEQNNGIGIGANGGFMGGYVKGTQYGLISQGEEFGMYISGNTITNAPIVQLTENNNKRVATYATTSTSVDVTTRGHAKLTNGETFVAFSEAFIGSVSSSELDKNVESSDAINITITPVGESNGVFIKSISNLGFYVKENAHGTSNVSFNWIAIGTKKGYENGVTISNEILANDFDSKMNGVMHNEADTNSKATPIYFDGNKVRFESMPEDKNKMAASIPVKKMEATKIEEDPKK